MASVVVTPVTDYTSLFQRRILTNAHYWCDFVTGHADDVPTLDGEREGIIKAITFGLDLAEAWPSVAELIANFSPHLERRGTWEGWNGLLERAIEQAEQVGDLAAGVHLSTLLARLCQRQSRAAETIRHYQRVMRLARQLGDDFSLARACSNLGYLYLERSRWQRAEVLCCRALTIFERLNSDHGRAHTENHLGVLYTLQGRWEQGITRLERACAIWEAMGDQHGLMRGFINLGLLYDEMERPDEALVFLEKALQQAKLTGEEVEIGKIYRNIGSAYQLKGQLETAETYIRKAEATFRRYLDSLNLVSLEHNLIDLYLHQGKLLEARSHLEANLEAWRCLNNKYGEIQTMIYFIKYELLRGDRPQAKIWLQEVLNQLSQHDPAKQYYQLYRGVDKLRRQLAEDISHA
jgi:tetratricopeptide (TPR) repeat protein